jgi:hypothetical protein
MDRREFVKFIALMSAGAAALPEQVSAFERYYDINTPRVGKQFAGVDEIMLCGTATRSVVVKANFHKEDELILPLSFNAFGGIMRWVAAPQQTIMCLPGDFSWRIEMDTGRSGEKPKDLFSGHVSYIDNEGFRRTKLLTELSGTL